MKNPYILFFTLNFLSSMLYSSSQNQQHPCIPGTNIRLLTVDTSGTSIIYTSQHPITADMILAFYAQKKSHVNSDKEKKSNN